MTETLRKPKERSAYNLNVVVPELRDILRGMDAEVDQAIDDFMEDYADGVITEKEFRAHLKRMVTLLKAVKRGVNVVNLLDESGPEAASREVQFQQRLRNGAKKP